MKREQIDYAKKVLKKMHPLYNLKIELCLPFLDPIIGVSRRMCGGSSAQTSPSETQGLAGADGLKNRDEELGI